MSSNDVAKLASEQAVTVAGEEQRKPPHPLGSAGISQREAWKQKDKTGGRHVKCRGNMLKSAFVTEVYSSVVKLM